MIDYSEEIYENTCKLADITIALYYYYHMIGEIFQTTESPAAESISQRRGRKGPGRPVK